VADPTVSVLVPLYQSEPWIAAALDSALAQTMSDFEVIVVDDGSTDGGPGIARAYAERDARVRYLRQENAGLPGARNTGLAAASGEYISFLDADDLWLPDKLERQLAAASDGVLYGDAFIMYDEGEPTSERLSEIVSPASGDIFDTLVQYNAVPVLTALVPTELMERFGGFDATQRQVEDWDLWLRMSASGVHFHYLPQPVAVYRTRTTSLSRDVVVVSTYRVRALRKVQPLVTGDRRDAVDRSLARELSLLAGELRIRAWKRAAEGDVGGARSDIDASLKAEPRSAKALLAAAIARVPPLLRAAARRELRGNP
jgi:glycosyltransferase involved in cell wall biosynthesis